MPAYFGLDIGSYSIKVIQIEKKRRQYKLIGFGEVLTPASLVSKSEADNKALIEAIKRVCNDARINTKEVVLSLSESAAFSQIIELPNLSQTELNLAVKFEAEQYIPVPLDEVELEYLVLSQKTIGKEKKMEILLVAARQDAINQLVELSEAAGLIPIAMETESLSIIRAMNLSVKNDCLVVGFGCGATVIMLLQEQNLKLVRTIKTGGAALTRAVSRDLNMEMFQAEQYKINYGLQANVLEGKIAKAIKPVFDLILIEIKKTLNFISQRYPEIKIKNLYAVGAGAALAGMNAYLAQNLNLEVIHFDPFVNFVPDEKFSQIKDKARFITAVGLALREEK